MIICIVGPTGIGKSKLAIEVCQKIHGELINGDAFQIYKEMDIGTAKPTLEERSLVPHHLFDYVEPTYEFSVYDYQKNLRKKIDELTNKCRPIVVCGGTGMYLKAGFYDFDLKRQTQKYDMSRFDDYTNEELHLVLEKVDFEEAMKIHMNNRKRVLRALEIFFTSGKKKSEIIDAQEHKPIYNVIFVGLNKDREELYDIINKRVDKMFEMGLLEEVQGLMNKYPHNLRAFQAIGYKEIIEGLDNGKSIEDIKELIKKNSRNYSKRQMTYFKHQMDVNWFDSVEEAYNFIIDKFNGK
jgi:tRNA dimethylallyltransferase